MKKGTVRKLTAVLAIALLSSAITSDYNSIGVRAGEEATIIAPASTTSLGDLDISEAKSVEESGDVPADADSQNTQSTENADVPSLTEETTETEDGSTAETPASEQGSGSDEDVAAEQDAQPEEQTPAVDNAQSGTEQPAEQTEKPEEEAATEQNAPALEESNAANDQSDDSQVDELAETAEVNEKAAPVDGNGEAADTVPEVTDGNGENTDVAPEVTDGNGAAELPEEEEKEITITFIAGKAMGSIVYNGSRKGDKYIAKMTKPETVSVHLYQNNYFLNWTDKKGNVVSTSKDFTPEGDLFKDGAVYTANFGRINKEKDIAFYILKTGETLLGPQPKGDHSDRKPHYDPAGIEWIGKVKKHLTELVEDESKWNYYAAYEDKDGEGECEYKNPDGSYSDLVRENVDYDKTTPSTITAINNYLKNTYHPIENTEQLTEKDVVWYVYKLEDDGYHIDGYPAAKVTYNSNYPAESKKENATPVVDGQRVNNTTYTVRDVKFDAPEGYFFAGWYMTPDCSGVEVKVGDKFENISYNVNLYAKWTKKVKIKIAITPDTDGQGPITIVKYNGHEQTANMNVHIYTSVEKEKNKAEKNESEETDEDGSKGYIEPQTVAIDVAGKMLDVTVSGLKVTGGHGKDVRTVENDGIDYYPIMLDMTEVKATVEGMTGDLNDWFTFDVDTSLAEKEIQDNAPAASGVEKNEETADEHIKEIGRLYILPRDVEFVSPSAEKVYDGTPLTAESVTVNKDGFADGEGATYNTFASQTEVGSTPNTFKYVLSDNVKLINYNFSEQYGTLKVTDNPQNNPPEDPKNPPKQKYTVSSDGFSARIKKDDEPKPNPNPDPNPNNDPDHGTPQVLGAIRPLNGTNAEQPAVLGAARSANTEDSTNTARIFILMGAAAAVVILLFISRKKRKEEE